MRNMRSNAIPNCFIALKSRTARSISAIIINGNTEGITTVLKSESALFTEWAILCE